VLVHAVKRGTICSVIWFLGLLVVLIIGATVVIASGRGGAMAPSHSDRPDALVPRGRDLRAEDLRELRFSLGFRGYRMDEVDALLRRLALQLEAAESAADSAATEPEDGE
jgi:DivIVA domain-containing protein